MSFEEEVQVSEHGHWSLDKLVQHSSCLTYVLEAQVDPSTCVMTSGICNAWADVARCPQWTQKLWDAEARLDL